MITVTITIVDDAIMVVHVITIVDVDARATVPPVVPVRMSVVRMAMIAVMKDVQTIGVPADRES
jgi:hypothetical protein